MPAQQADTLHSPHLGCVTYAVHIYNRTVRERVKQNEPSHLHSERWAEEQMHEVCADSPEEAREIAASRFPESDGFVITSIQPAGSA